MMQSDTYLPPVRVSVTSGLHAPRHALSALLDRLGPLQLDIEEAGTLELILAEALNNICEHAYSGQENSGPIDIACVHGPNGLQFQIEDEGAPMPGGRTPLGVSADVDVELADMPEGGFGWFLIKDLAKDVQYQRSGTRNQLRLRVAIGLQAAA
ncbi:MAG: ATP-binding protein [Pseudomonadota bacterium]